MKPLTLESLLSEQFPSNTRAGGRHYPNERPRQTTRGVLVGKPYTKPSDSTDFVLRGGAQTRSGLPVRAGGGGEEKNAITRFGGSSPLIKAKVGPEALEIPEEPEHIKFAQYTVDDNPRLKAPEEDGKPEGPKPEKLNPVAKKFKKPNSTAFALRTPAAFFGKKTNVGGTLGPPARKPTTFADVKRTARNIEAAKLRWARSKSRPLAQALRLGAPKLPK